MYITTQEELHFPSEVVAALLNEALILNPPSWVDNFMCHVGEFHTQPQTLEGFLSIIRMIERNKLCANTKIFTITDKWNVPNEVCVGDLFMGLRNLTKQDKSAAERISSGTFYSEDAYDWLRRITYKK